MATMDFDLVSNQSPLRQFFTEAERRDSSIFGQAVMDRLQSLLKTAAHISPEFRAWLVEDYQQTRRVGFLIEEEWFGAPWIDSKGKDGIFSDDIVYAKSIEMHSHLAVYELQDISKDEYDKIRSEVFGSKKPQNFSPSESAFVNWRMSLIKDGYIDIEEE